MNKIDLFIFFIKVYRLMVNIDIKYIFICLKNVREG